MLIGLNKARQLSRAHTPDIDPQLRARQASAASVRWRPYAVRAPSVVFVLRFLSFILHYMYDISTSVK